MNIISRRILTVALPIVALALAGCIHDTSVPDDTDNTPLADVLEISRSVASTVSVNETFSVEVTVQTTDSLLGVLVEESFGGFELVDVGTFNTVEATQLKGVLIQTSAGDSTSFRYQLRCTEAGSFTLRGIAKSKNVLTAEVSSTVECS
jgi:hypothetical protein